MGHNEFTRTISKFFAVGTGLGLGVAIVVVATGNALGELPTAERLETRGKFHKCTLPKIDLVSDTPCALEMAAYAAAFIAFEDALQVADEAYNDLLVCQDEQDYRSDDSVTLQATASVLER